MPKSKIGENPSLKLDDPKDKKKKAKQSSSKASSSKSKTSTGSTPGAKKTKAPRTNLKPLKEQLDILITEANRRAAELKAEGYDQSRAMTEAQRTAIRFHKDKETGDITSLFTSQLPSMKDIAREYARVQTFLSDETSMLAGAKREQGDIMSGLFGGQYRAMYGTGYDITRVSKEQGDLTLEVYHKILEKNGGWERVISHLRATNTGLTQYGSEQLIQHIYDVITSGDYEGYSADELVAVADVELRAIIDMNDAIAERQRLGINYGLLDDSLDQDAYDRAMWKEYRKKLKG